MAETIIDVLVDGGKASGGPPLGPALGPVGVNVKEVVDTINEKTKDFTGMKVPVKVIVESSDRSFRIEVGSPPVSALIKKELNIEKGSGKPRTEKVAELPMAFALKIAKMKQDSMLAASLKAALKEVLGTCVSLGVTVEGKEPVDVQKEIDEGKWDDAIEGKIELKVDKAELEKKKAELVAAAEATRAEEAAAKAEEEAAKPVVEKKEGEEEKKEGEEEKKEGEEEKKEGGDKKPEEKKDDKKPEEKKGAKK